MYDTAAHVQMVRQRVYRRQHRKRRNMVRRLTGTCLVLFAALIYAVYAVVGWKPAGG